jgi:hypothetical protein
LRIDSGGCAVNLSDGLAELGVPVDCFATLGAPRHPVFDKLAARRHRCQSWDREYGRTLAFEFADGKLMYSAVSQLAEMAAENRETGRKELTHPGASCHPFIEGNFASVSLDSECLLVSFGWRLIQWSLL